MASHVDAAHACLEEIKINAGNDNGIEFIHCICVGELYIPCSNDDFADQVLSKLIESAISSDIKDILSSARVVVCATHNLRKFKPICKDISNKFMSLAPYEKVGRDYLPLMKPSMINFDQFVEGCFYKYGNDLIRWAQSYSEDFERQSYMEYLEGQTSQKYINHPPFSPIWIAHFYPLIQTEMEPTYEQQRANSTRVSRMKGRVLESVKELLARIKLEEIGCDFSIAKRPRYDYTPSSPCYAPPPSTELLDNIYVLNKVPEDFFVEKLIGDKHYEYTLKCACEDIKDMNFCWVCGHPVAGVDEFMEHYKEAHLVHKKDSHNWISHIINHFIRPFHESNFFLKSNEREDVFCGYKEAVPSEFAYC